jgi:hypothetical protein
MDYYGFTLGRKKDLSYVTNVSRPVTGPRQSVIKMLWESLSLVGEGFEITFVSRNVSAVIFRQSCKIQSIRKYLKLYEMLEA